MKPLSPNAIHTLFALWYAFTPALSQQALKPLVYQGCFSSSQPLSDQGSYMYQSPGYCQQQCVNKNKPVMGTTQGSNCWCGDLIPAADSKVPDSKCSSACNGYNKDMCGGPSQWSVQLTGIDNSVGNYQGSDSGSGSGSDSNPNPGGKASSSSVVKQVQPTPKPDKANNGPASVITKASTVVVTAPGQTNGQTIISVHTETPAPQGPNKAGIAAGVVVGVVVLCSIAGGIFFFVRHKKKRAVEEEYHRTAAINNYSAKPPSSSSQSVSDSRLEPSVMMQRRQSDGSIADNQDYSRRILKVTNPDGT